MAIPYNDAVNLIAYVYGVPASNIDNLLSGYNIYNGEEALAYFKETEHFAGAGIKSVTNGSGATVGRYAEIAGETGTVITNSNVATKAAVKVPLNYKLEQAAQGTKLAAKTGVKQTGRFVFGEVVPAVAAAGFGVTMGKTIDNALYNVAPDFWDSVGMGAMDPDTWNDIITQDSGGNPLFNMVFGIDPDTGETQAYLEEQAATYLAMYMNSQGVFANGTEIPSAPSWTAGQRITSLNTASIAGTLNSIALYTNTLNRAISEFNRIKTELGYADDDYVQFETISTNNYIIGNVIKKEQFLNDTVTSVSGTYFYVYNGTWGSGHRIVARERGASSYSTNSNNLMTGRYTNSGIFANIPVSNVDVKTQPQGIGTQDGAVVPTGTNNWTDINNTKQSLQNQYPDLWNNAIDYEYVDDDGTNKSKKYIPINLPNAVSKFDNQPTSGNEKQSKPDVDPTSPETLKDLITQIVTQLPPTNPDPTGSGDTPVVPVPTGSASSLWAVYNPTQAQVDAFGSWLWSSDLVEQIKKLFNDPMQAIIGIHKVFATPATGAAQNIKCGYIDSGVPSAVVTNQYTTVDCGTVNLREQFANVFDYSPFTEVSLYLPFIGIVKLDVGDVMRASIKVKYHVDVITGACLADVIVNRDGSGGVLYQYSGSAIVTYPLSSGSYASALAGVVSIAGGIAATVATGGAAAPALLGAAVGVSHLHSDVQKSGSFSGAAGAMGGKKPYLIISRPQTAMPSSYKHLEGQPTNHYVQMSSCSGYVKIKQVQVKGLNATDTEMDMIKELLLQGVEM